MNHPVIKIKKKQEIRVRNGHPWIFSNEIENHLTLEPGTIVEFTDYKNYFIGRGYYNPHSLITGRLLTRNPQEDITLEYFRNRISHCLKYREWIYPGESSYRLTFSEGDHLPGLIIDRYNDHLVMQILTAGMDKWKEELYQILIETVPVSCIYERSDSSIRSLESLPRQSGHLWGEPDHNLHITQDGITFQVDIREGQKTGFFFDHRDNRKCIKNLVQGKTVLDLFCGTGSWSLYAARYGARKVIGIDSSKTALDIAQNNARMNALELVCSFELDDVFDAEKKLIKQGAQFDVVLCDPPAFAKFRSHLPAAIKGYRKLNTMAIQMVKPGGFLISSSCSYHIQKETFRRILLESALSVQKSARLIRTGTQALDHPILMEVPETEYLKCFTIQIL